MALGQAIHRLSGELADFIGVDAGRIRVGDRADLVIIDPTGLTDALDEMHEAPMEVLGLERVVKRNDAAVDATLINGRIAYRRGLEYPDDLGKAQGYGRFLPGRDVLPRQAPSGALQPATA
jgi:N-acyl-D-aspartate/D-glutamate deacylase